MLIRTETSVETVGETADHVIQNFGTLDDLIRNVLNLAKRLKEK